MPQLEPGALVVAILHQQPLQKLLKAGADPAVPDQAGLTPLHHAVLAGNVEAVEVLLDHVSKCVRPLRQTGGEPSRAPGSPWDLVTAPGAAPFRPTPLHLAAERSESLLRLILSHRSLTCVSASFLGIPISSRPRPELLHLRDARGWTLLHYAVSRSNLATIKHLLPHMGAHASDLGSSSSRSSSTGGAPLHGAVHATCSGINIPDSLGRTVLHQAAHLGHADSCRLLLKAGAEQSLVSALPEGALPLHLAAAGNHTAAIEVLFRQAVQKAGFRAAQDVLLCRNAAGLTALHIAVQHGAVDAARRLLHLVFPFDTRGPLGRTALHIAALLGNTAMISMLLGHSTRQQRQLRDSEGFTALHLAAATGHLEALRVLVAGGCAVDVRAEDAPHAPVGCEGWTPLHCAVRRGDVVAIELLITELGADPHAKDTSGRTPYDLAVAVAGDSSRQGSSVVGTGSGIQNIDDAQWGGEATGTESEEGGRGGSSSIGALSGTTPTGVFADCGEAVVEPLQGPSGVTAGLHGLGGTNSGSGSTRLDEAQALAVLHTFIRLLHEPALRKSGLPPAVVSALSGPSGHKLIGLTSTSPQPQQPQETAAAMVAALPANGAPEADDCARLQLKPSSPVLDAIAGAPPLPAGIASGTATREERQTPGPPLEAEQSPGAGDGEARGAGAVVSVEQAVIVSRINNAGVEPVAAAPETGRGAGAAKLSKDSGDITGGDVQGTALPNGHENCRGSCVEKILSAVDGAGGPMHAPSVALAYAAQMLAGPPPTPARLSPFAKAAGRRPSPFCTAPAATATVVPVAAKPADIADEAAATPGAVPASGVAHRDDSGTAVVAICDTTNAVAAGNGATATRASCVEATITTTIMSPHRPSPFAAPGAIKRSPFTVSARPSPFAAASAAGPRLAPFPHNPPPSPSPLLIEQNDLPKREDSAAGVPAALQTPPATAVATTVTARAVPLADIGPSRAPHADGTGAANAADGSSSPSLVPPPAERAETGTIWSQAPGIADGEMHQRVRSSLPGGSLMQGPFRDPVASLCVVSAINSPCGYSALNRAILLQRNGLAEALLATLPPQGHHGNVLVLAGAAPDGYSGTGWSGNVAAMASQPFRAASMGVPQLHLAPATSSDGRENSNGTCGNGGGGGCPPSRPTISRIPTARTISNSAAPAMAPLCPSARPQTPLRNLHPQQPQHAPPPPQHAQHAPPPQQPQHAPPPQHAQHAPPPPPPQQQQQQSILKNIFSHQQLPASSSRSSPAHSDAPVPALGALPPLLPLRLPGTAAAQSMSTMSTAAPGAAVLVPGGVLTWDEASDLFRTLPVNQTQRAWLHWPGEPDPSTGWLVAELVVVDAGAAGGHVWLGVGPAPEALVTATSSNSAGSGSLMTTGQFALPAAASAAAEANAPGRSVSTPPQQATAAATTTRSGPVGAGMGAHSCRGAGAGGAGGGGGGGVGTAPIPVAMCPVMNHRATHVACIRDGQAFRGGVLTADLGTAARLEARNGDTVALFWNRRGRSVAFTLNGRYCGRLSELPTNTPLTPLVGTQCGGFTFKWRCCSRVWRLHNGSASTAAAGQPPEPYTCPTCTSNIDGMLIREQMLHEDPETPWLCKPSMTSIHFAAWSGNGRVLPQLVRSKGFSPDDEDVDGWTPLHFAALAGQDEVVRMLLQLGCHPDRWSKYGSTPAMVAAKYGRSPEHVAIVRLLSDVGAVLNVRDPRGRTLLMLAARAGNLAMVQLLLERGLDPSATDAVDREVQQYAGQHAAIFRLLRSVQAAQRAGARKDKRRQQVQQQTEQQPQPPEQPQVATSAMCLQLDRRGEVGAVEGGEGSGSDLSNSTDAETEADTEGDTEVICLGRGRELDAQHLPLLAEKWRLGAGQLTRGRLIEQGAFGAVYEGNWCGARVAIKQVMRRRHVSPRRSKGNRVGGASDGGEGEGEDEEDPEAMREAAALEREVAILAALPPHERITRMLGSVHLPGEGVCLVMAYYPHTLQGVMQSERLRRSWLTPSRRASIVRQLAEGLAFLHGLPGPRVIHRDLKPNNVLLEAAPSLGVKICDFGLSRILAGNDVQSSSAAGHAFWMAPELLRALPYDEKVDVYSYGVILYQMAYWVDDQLYGGLNKAQVDFQVVHGILRLQDRLPGGIDPAVQSLVRDCVDTNVRNRPSMAQVLERLATVRELPQPGHGTVVTHTHGHAHGHAPVAVAAGGTPGDMPTRLTVAGGLAAVVAGEGETHRQG